MSIPQNINAVDLNPKSSEKNYFNNFFVDLGTVATGKNDALISYFEKQTRGNKQAASALTSAVIFTALSQGVDPMSVLDEFIKLPEGQLNSYLCTFLNLNRVGTSYLGYNAQPPTSKYVTRAILP